MNNTAVNKIFEDLDRFREFCVEYGHRFDESNLYNMRNYSYQQFSKFQTGKAAKNQWAEDAKKYEAALNNF